MSEAQIRITLLQGLKSALVDGEFAANVEAVRTECRDRKTLDDANFAANCVKPRGMTLPVFALDDNEMLIEPFPVLDHDINLSWRTGLSDERHIVLDLD
jgi:hypothetical protein